MDETSPLLRKQIEQECGARDAEEALPADNDDASSGRKDQDAALEPGTWKIIAVLGPTYLGLFFAALDATIIATLTAPISASFNSGTLLSWLASAYIISNAAMQPLSGKLTDIFGRRSGMVLAHTFFAVGTLICGLARNEATIILGRVIAGLGGGCIHTVGTFMASDLVPLRKRGVWQALANVVYGVGSGLGGVFGGWVSDISSWRWAFLVQVPFITLGGVVVFFAVDIPVKETDTARWKRVDFLGAFTLLSSLVLLLVGLNSGGNTVPWNHPLVYITLILAFVLLGVFIYVEDKVASEPTIPVRLLLDRTVASACLTNWFIAMARFAMLYYAPVYFQLRGSSAAAAGARLVPDAVGISVGSMFVGAMMRWTGRYYMLNIFVELCTVAAGILLFVFLRLNSPAWPAFVVFFLTGIGVSGMLVITLLAIISAVDREHHAVMTSASYAFRSTGTSIGIAVASAVFQNVLRAQLWKRFGDRDNAAEIIKNIRNSIEYVKELPPEWKEGTMMAFMDAFRGVWITVLALAVVGALTSMFMREHVLHTSLARK